MNNIKTARLMRGMNQKELAEKLGISNVQLNQIEVGTRNAGPKILPMLAEALGVDEAYLRGTPQHLSVIDPLNNGTAYTCAIMSETVIDDYGILYTVEQEDIGAMQVILSAGVQFTPRDWQDAQMVGVDEIGDVDWMDWRGQDAIMMDGLPRVIE